MKNLTIYEILEKKILEKKALKLEKTMRKKIL